MLQNIPQTLCLSVFRGCHFPPPFLLLSFSFCLHFSFVFRLVCMSFPPIIFLSVCCWVAVWLYLIIRNFAVQTSVCVFFEKLTYPIKDRFTHLFTLKTLSYEQK